MRSAARFLLRHAVALQIAGVLCAFMAIALLPPARGAMMLVPVWPGAQSRLIARAVDDGALLVGRGPLPGSLVVWGERRRLAGPLVRRGVLVLAAPEIACGKVTAPA